MQSVHAEGAVAREVGVWLLPANGMRTGAINCKAPNSQRTCPLLDGEPLSERVCGNGGWALRARLWELLEVALVLPGHHRFLSLSRDPAATLAAGGRMVALARSHTEPPWLKCPLPRSS